MVELVEVETLGVLQRITETGAGNSCKIDDVKFSPNSEFLAVGNHEGLVDIFFCNIITDASKIFYKKIGTCKGHTSFITHLDWSKDSKVLQTDSGSYEHLFWDIEDVKQITKSSSVRNVEFVTYTCVLGWPVRGIWPKGSDGTDINSLCRSNNGLLLVTADDSSMVKIFAFPANVESGKFFEYNGHSSHVTNVRFSFNDENVLSTGGNDRTVMQWKCTKHTPATTPKKINPPAKDSTPKKPTNSNSAASPPTKKAAPGKQTPTPNKSPSKPASPAKAKPVASPSTTPKQPADNSRLDSLEKRVQELEATVHSLSKTNGNGN